MSFDSFTQLLNTFANKIGIGSLKIDESGYCCLSVDEGMFVHLKHEPKRDNMIFLSEIGDVPSMDEAKAMRYMLFINNDQVETKGMTLSYNKESNKFAIGYQYPLQFLDNDKFEEFFKMYLEEVERWMKKIAEFLQGSIPSVAGGQDEGQRDQSLEVPPPFMMGAIS